jgi:hypothetical protein
MSDEKAFRPQRKSIDSSEFNTDAAMNQAKLNEIAQIQRAAAEEIGEQPPAMQGIQITGNPPPAWKAAMEQRGPKLRNVDPNAGQQPLEIVHTPQEGTSETYQSLLSKIKQAKLIYEEIELPSKGRFYDGTTGPRNGKLHIRPMTGQEEEILATSRFVKKGQAMNMIFNKCIQEDYNAEDFLTEDRTYLLIYLRGISYTPQYDVEVVCPGCDRRFGHTINLNELYVDACPDDFHQNIMTDILPTSNIPFKYRLSTGADEQRIQDYRERKNKEATGTDDTLLYRSSMLILDLGGITNKNEILQLLKQLPINDVAYIRNTVSEPPFGVDTDVDIYCPGCLQEFTIDLPLEADFFFPRKRKKSKELTEK